MSNEIDVVVVTGAASGIGAATVRRFLAAGASVIGVDIATSARSNEQASLAWVQGSVADATTWEAVLTASANYFGAPPTVLVSNAARFGSGNVLTTPLDGWRQMLEVNLFGAVLGIRACLPAMVERRKGAIVTVASVDAFLAEQDLVSYCTSKGALVQLMRCVALDFARDGVRANAVCPGTVASETFERIHREAPDGDALLEVRRNRNPLGRILEPDEVASAIEFLASDASSGMTGSILTVDAGLSTSFDFRPDQHREFRIGL
jgi:NAD(P)-dependent dehydrogenase (short-subunit alcohol dehydrogenase family)